MDTDMTFPIDSEVKAQMFAICKDLGMTPSTAFNIFANAFVQSRGMPFPVTVQAVRETVSKEDMLHDAERLLAEFTDDYNKMAE